MPNLMAAQPNIGGALCERSAIPFLVPRHKVCLTPAAPVPCNNAANIGERKTWAHSELCSWQNSVREQLSRQKCIYSLSAQETAKDRAVLLASGERRRSEDAKHVEICWVSQNLEPSQPLVGRSSPYCANTWRRYCCLTSFFRLSIRAPVAKIQLSTFVRWCPDGEFLDYFLHSVFSASRVQHSSDLLPKSGLRPPHVWKCGRHPICDGRLDVYFTAENI